MARCVAKCNGGICIMNKYAISCAIALSMTVAGMGGYAFAGAPAEVVFSAADAEIVVAGDASPVTRFSAGEMQKYLSKVFGSEVPISKTHTPGRKSIIISSAEMPRDAFSLKTCEDGIVIAGKDDPSVDLESRIAKGSERALWVHRATLFGVYEFLERFAGVRFYFPGELGEVVPRRDRVVCAADEVQHPRYLVRKYSFHNDRNGQNQRWYEDGFDCRSAHVRKMKSLQFMRNRMETDVGVPCCHGLRSFDIQKRFAKSHPEYLALLLDPYTKKTYRDADPGEKRHHAGQLCHSSAVWDVFFEDSTNRLAKGEKYIDVMPQDGFRPCQCAECRAAWKAGDPHYATELVWRRTAELARRLAPYGGVVTQMAYTPYRRVPDFDLPCNVKVMVAENGPWSLENRSAIGNEVAEIRAWAEKTHGKVWIWTYPCKLGQMDLKDIVQMTPRAYGRYYSMLEPWIFGAYAESESDSYLANYLNQYVFGKVCWNPVTDVSALLEEHYRLMFGPAAGEMKAFFEGLEDKWMREVSGRVVDTPLGPKAVPPAEYELWTRVYARDVLDGWRKALDRASEKTVPGSLERRRVDLFRREFFAPLERARSAYMESIDVKKGLARDAASTAANLVDNGEFKTTDGWRSFVGNRSFAVDASTSVSGGSSLRLWSTNRSDVAYYLDGKLKPRTKYRISWCMKLEDVRLLGGKGGVYGELIADAYFCMPRLRAPTGTADWTYQSYEIETSDTIGARDKRPYFHFLIQNATGTAWFDALRIEELKTENGEVGR